MVRLDSGSGVVHTLANISVFGSRKSTLDTRVATIQCEDMYHDTVIYVLFDMQWGLNFGEIDNVF